MKKTEYLFTASLTIDNQVLVTVYAHKEKNLTDYIRNILHSEEKIGTKCIGDSWENGWSVGRISNNSFGSVYWNEGISSAID